MFINSYRLILSIILPHPLLNSRIRYCIQDVRQKISQNQDCTGEHRESHNQRIVSGVHRIHGKPPDPRPGKHTFNDKRAAHQPCQIDPYQVIIGSRQFFRTWRVRILYLLVPLDLAVST